MPLGHKTQNENKRDLTYQRHLREWDIPQSEPSCFSYNHNLKVAKNTSFLNIPILIFFSLYMYLIDNNAFMFEKKFM